MSRLTRFFASAVLILSFLAFMPGSADARWRGGYWRGGWGWGPAFGLGLGLGYGWGWGYPYAYYPGPYYYRDASGAGLRLGTRACLAQRTLGISPGVALLVNESPPARRAFCVSFKDPRYFHSRTSTKCPAIAAAPAIAGDTRCVRPL
jgi:hypothetical protein